VTRALDVADLRDDDDLVAGKFTGVDQLLQGAADETPVTIVDLDMAE